MFYHFSQNNSGGRFRVDHGRGLSHHVVVEGTDVRDITRRAEDIGLYWDGCRDDRDCSCCGDRWYRPASYSTLDDTPSIYGEDVTAGVYVSDTKWIDDGPEGYVHYMDGRVVPVILQKKVKTKKSK